MRLLGVWLTLLIFFSGPVLEGKLRFGDFTIAAESTTLRFTQTTASPLFSAEGKFAGQTISDVAAQLRAGTLRAADVPVTVVGDGLIANTRSSLALRPSQRRQVLTIDKTQSELVPDLV